MPARGVVAAALLGCLLTQARVATAADSRELQGREAFAAGRFQEALDIFAKLYAGTLHPTYLRNIGRCYMNLSQPDKAITSFREYLRKARHVTKSERAEVEGYIKEMEALKRTQEAQPRPEPEPPKPEPKPEPEPRLALNPPPPPPPGDHPLIAREAPPPKDDGATPVYGKWWFWAIVGAVAIGGGVGIYAATRGKSDPECSPGRVCP